MFRSATFKLTIWYLAIIVAISLVFSVVVYHLAVNQITDGLNHQSRRFSEEFPAFSSNPQLREQEEISNSRHQIITNLILFNGLVLISAGFGSYALARRTLGPIEEAHEQQKRFTADVSHELRTPLTALKMETEVALLDPALGKPDLKAALRSNLEEVAKLEQIINNLLKLTRLEAEELQQVFSDVPIKKVVDAAIAQTSQMATAKNIAISSTGKDTNVLGDEATLTQLIVILLDNAIKYSDKGSSVEIVQSGTDKLATIKIIDHGVGIEKAALEHVFERFYRANKARSNSTTQGYGLGLSIAKHIGDMHHGTIELSSRVGKGTTATVTLPK